MFSYSKHLPSYVEQSDILFCNLSMPWIDWCAFSCNPLKPSYQSIVDPLFRDFLFCILFVLLEEFFLIQGNCTFPQLSLLLKVSTLMGGMQWVNDYQLYYLFEVPSDRALYNHVSSIQADHLLPSIFYSFVRKHVHVDCSGS